MGPEGRDGLLVRRGAPLVLCLSILQDLLTVLDAQLLEIRLDGSPIGAHGEQEPEAPDDDDEGEDQARKQGEHSG